MTDTEDRNYLVVRADFGNWLLQAPNPTEALRKYRRECPDINFRALYQHVPDLNTQPATKDTAEVFRAMKDQLAWYSARFEPALALAEKYAPYIAAVRWIHEALTDPDANDTPAVGPARALVTLDDYGRLAPHSFAMVGHDTRPIPERTRHGYRLGPSRIVETLEDMGWYIRTERDPVRGKRFIEYAVERIPKLEVPPLETGDVFCVRCDKRPPRRCSNWCDDCEAQLAEARGEEAR